MHTYFTELIAWFKQNKRDLPWRVNRSFYRVWISEVMLQQTRAQVVIFYFLKWMQKFPTIESLARAPIEDVIKTWEGLGYYSRARNLHAGAQQLVRLDTLPRKDKELQKIKGIGPYTSGAIQSFVYKKKALAIDANVLRVLSRLYLVTEPIENPKTKQHIADLLWKDLPEEKNDLINEALIELGALVCQKKPKCLLCPLQKYCLAKKEKKETLLPVRLKKTRYVKEKRIVTLLVYKNKVLVRKNEKKLMKDLYEFPYFSCSEFPIKISAVQKWVHETFSSPVVYQKTLSSQKHTFTHFRVELFPFLFSFETKKEIDSYSWVEKKQLYALPFSAGHRKIKEDLFAHTSY